MGVKSTVYLTREEAECKYWSYFNGKIDMTDADLEDELMRLNDHAHDGEGFENYIIGEYRRDEAWERAETEGALRYFNKAKA